MTSFKDGPAQGQSLMLKRAPIYLRVVQDGDGMWDGLDQPSDEPAATEKVFAYKITGQPGHCHINMGRGRGGFYPIAEYAICPDQPTDAEMRSYCQWAAWCEAKEKAEEGVR